MIEKLPAKQRWSNVVVNSAATLLVVALMTLPAQQARSTEITDRSFASPSTVVADLDGISDVPGSGASTSAAVTMSEEAVASINWDAKFRTKFGNVRNKCIEAAKRIKRNFYQFARGQGVPDDQRRVDRNDIQLRAANGRLAYHELTDFAERTHQNFPNWDADRVVGYTVEGHGTVAQEANIGEAAMAFDYHTAWENELMIRVGPGAHGVTEEQIQQYISAQQCGMQ